jgi:hypothetical protein
MARQMVFCLEGRLIVLERFEDETDGSFAERSSFVLAFRNDPVRYELALQFSEHHVQKMFKGVTYNQTIEVALRELREAYLELKKFEGEGS